MTHSKISAVLIVRDETDKLEACLASCDWMDEIIIVHDNTARSETIEIAQRHKAKIFKRNFDNFSAQKNFALTQAAGAWLFSIDADEIISPELRASIEGVLTENPQANGFEILRKNIIFGKFLRFGGQGRERIVRLFRRGKGRFERPVHETLVIDGRVGELRGDLIHRSTATLAEYKRKLTAYTDIEARLLTERGVRVGWSDIYLKPILRFGFFYFFKLGFLDGKSGLLYHFLSSYYYYLKCKKVQALQAPNRS